MTYLPSLTDKKNKNKSQEFFAKNRKVEKSRKKFVKMSHWFHRNPLKATAPQTFENIKMVAQDVEAIKIIR